MAVTDHSISTRYFLSVEPFIRPTTKVGSLLKVKTAGFNFDILPQ
jgi:hypothetical protein